MFYLSFGLVLLTGGYMVQASIEHLPEFKCSSAVEYQWFINPKNPDRCINFVSVTSFDFTQCFLTKLKDMNYTVVLVDISVVLSRNVLILNKTNCNDFIIHYNNSTDMIQQLFQKGTKIFFPYSYIFLIANTEPRNVTDNIFKFILENALNVYHVKIDYTNGYIKFKEIMNILTDQSSENPQNFIGYFENFQKHPFLMNKNRKRKLRVSVFNCPPYVTYLTIDDGKNGFDGIEYRFIKESFKDWQVNFQKLDISEIDSWYQTVIEIERNASDIAICSIWMTVSHNVEFDITSYFDYQCGTFLVPQPSIVNDAYKIYTTLNPEVWFFIMGTVVITSVCLTYMSKIGSHLLKRHWKDEFYTDTIRSFIDVIGMASSHGVSRFPRQGSIKVLIVSWMLYMLLITNYYSTGYTSKLTIPLYGKPIDSLKDFVEHKLYWGLNSNSTLANNFRLSNESYFKELAELAVKESDLYEKVHHLKTKNYGLLAKVLSNNFVTDIGDVIDEAKGMRVMKSCIFKRYTAMALVRNSPFTAFINFNIRRYQESGILKHWSSHIMRDTNKFSTKVDFGKRKKEKRLPQTLQLENITGAFWLLFVGQLISACVFIMEYYQLIRLTKKC